MFRPFRYVLRRAGEARIAMRDSEGRDESFRLLFANNPQPMWVYDRDTLAFLEVNQAAVRHYGYSRDEFLSMRITDIRPEEEVPRLLDAVKHRSDDMRADDSFRHRRKDGGLIDVEIDSHSLEFAHRSAVLVVARDVTERRRTEEAMRRSEQRLRAIFQTSPIGIEITDLQGCVIETNAAMQEILGYSQEELCGRLFTDVVHPDDVAEEQMLDAELVAGKRDRYQLERRHIRKDGSVGWTRVTAALFSDGTDTLGVGMMEDVTERRQAEEALRESEERFRVIFDQAGIGINLSDASGSLLTANPAFCAMLGYTADELQGVHFADITHPDDVGSDAGLFEQLVRGLRDAYQIEKRYLHKSGEERWVLLTVTVVRGAAGELLNTVAMAEDISERKAYEEQLHFQASHDALTGLPNRLLLQDRLDQAILTATREKRPAALLLTDMDRFKEINDTYGHHVGDLFLQELALRIKSVLRESDTVARLGGDEFAVVLPRADEEGALQVVRKIRAVLRKPFVLEGQQLNFGASMGIALCPEHGSDANTLLRRADVAMYVAKRMQRGHVVYTPEQDTYSPERLRIMSDLRHAIEQNELMLHFQPMASLITGVVQDVEALVRWNHPERGLIPPGQFIALAEETGLIEPMTLWVLETALEQCKVWRRVGLELGVAVNLSARNMHDLALADVIIEMVQQKGVRPSQLTVEITESTLMADMEQAGALLAQLHAAGVRIAIDDFGTGYSSLGRLKDLPVDEIKIDRSFVMNMIRENAAIVRSIIELGHNLGLRVVAEGVEDQDTWDALTLMRCDLAQGYHLSRPLPAEEVTRWQGLGDCARAVG